MSVAGPGFINIKLSGDGLAKQLPALMHDDRLGVNAVSLPRTFVVDYSGPNVAKPLHVGHLRSTIIGDALTRILKFLGHTVIGDNHLGDWGTQFGILIYGYKNHLDEAAYRPTPCVSWPACMCMFATLAKVTDDDDEAGTGDVMQQCRDETAKLHAGDPENLQLWQQFMPACLEMLRPIYDRLDVHIDHALGESYYNPMLAGIVDELLAKGIAQESNGAVVIPNAKGVIPTTEQVKEEPPALIRKRDGAFTYTTTDLATIRHRMETWQPDAMLYVVDARQALHFKTLFANAKRWAYPEAEFEHCSFGSVLGSSRKPLKTRDGTVPELGELIDSAVSLGKQKYQESYDKRKAEGHELPELDAATIANIAEVIGVGAVKYADLSSNRTSDYVFDYDKMLATDGNTATYMQYAYARCQSIIRKAETDTETLLQKQVLVQVTHPAERALCLQLLRFEEAVHAAACDYLPHLIAAHLWDTARAASVFYVECHVLNAETAELRESRLTLAALTGKMIRQSLALLGIRVVERM